jgi:hypothetical protein
MLAAIPRKGDAMKLMTCLAAATMLVLAGAALGAHPKNSGRYDGYLHKDGMTALQKHLRVVVDPSGKSGTLLWWCGKPDTISNRSLAKFPVKPDGTFNAVYRVGSLTVWSASGRFVSATSVRVQLRIIATCDAKGGLATLALS